LLTHYTTVASSGGAHSHHWPEGRRPPTRSRFRRSSAKAGYGSGDPVGTGRERRRGRGGGNRRAPGDEGRLAGPPAHPSDSNHGRERDVRRARGPRRRNDHRRSDVQDRGGDGGPLRRDSRPPDDLGHGEI